MTRRFGLFAALLALLLLATVAPVAAQPPGTPTTRGTSRTAVDRYIVVLADEGDDPNQAAAELGRRHGFQADQVYEFALRGFAGVIPAARLAQLKADPRVRYVAPDREASLAVQQAPTGVRRVGASTDAVRQTLANDGAGVGVAVIDSGIELNHPDLKATINGKPALVSGKSCIAGARTANDDHGHGTHVAGSIAARENGAGVVGVAPGATLYAVKVIDRNGYGTTSHAICGIDWVTANAARYNIKVANISLRYDGWDDGNCGRSNNDPLHQAICRSISTAKVTYVAAAGNDSSDAAYATPAAYSEVIAASALGDWDGQPGGDSFPSWSNFGGAVDIAGPGVDIYSTARGGGYTYMSGTSMASPHVAGAAALYLSTNPTATPAQVLTALRATGECADDTATTAGPRFESDGNHNGDAYTCATAWPGAPWHHEPMVRADRAGK